jgi:hypothetical protein
MESQMPLQILNGPIIQAGESLSDGVDCSAGALVKITMPGNWVDAVLTFQTSSDGIMYNDMFMPNGTELTYTVIAGTGIFVPRLTTGFLKFRSGTRERPVAQPELREFAVALDVLGAGGGVNVPTLFTLQHRFGSGG